MITSYTAGIAGQALAAAMIAGLAGICGLGGPRHEHTALASACLLMTTMAVAILIVSDAYEFSWRYQLPALVLLPQAGVLGAAAITARVKFEIVSWRGIRTYGAAARSGTGDHGCGAHPGASHNQFRRASRLSGKRHRTVAVTARLVYQIYRESR